jgi:hypothetical protein
MGTLIRLLFWQHEGPFCGPAVPAIGYLRPETLKPLTFFRFFLFFFYWRSLGLHAQGSMNTPGQV